MKTTKSLIYALALGAISFNLQAQFTPWEQFFYNTLWDTPVHDSITIWNDSVHPSDIYGSLRTDFNASGMIDSMIFRDRHNTNGYFFSGKSLGNTHVVASFQYDQFGILVPSIRTIFEFDNLNRVAAVYTAYFNGTIYVEDLKYEVIYDAAQKIETIVVRVAQGSSYMPVSKYEYNYDGSVLDSVNVSMIIVPMVTRRYQPVYDNAGRMRGLGVWDRVDNWNTKFALTSNYVFELNQNQEIRYVTEYRPQPLDTVPNVNQVFEYSVREKNTIGIPQEEELQVEVYPNPASDYLIINGEEDLEYSIFDLGGKQVLSGEVADRIILSELKSGQYLLHLTDKKGNIATRKVLKI